LANIIKGDYEYQAVSRKKIIAGVDEVGRGCLAGPVYTAAVVLDLKKLFALDHKSLELIRDSKKLSAKQRAKSLETIKKIAQSITIGISDVATIDCKGIVPATFLAMHKSVKNLNCKIDYLLVDGNKELPEYRGKQQAIIKGDNLSFSIAAASIVAKQARDAVMQKSHLEFIEYGFSTNVGYGTKTHLCALKKYGPCVLHRKSFEPVKSMVV
jgi:ribonuclease HII